MHAMPPTPTGTVFRFAAKSITVLPFVQMKNTPLMVACQLGHRAIALSVAAYTEDACDFNMTNRAGLCALHLAYQSKCFEVAMFLLAKGALVDCTNQVCNLSLSCVNDLLLSFDKTYAHIYR